MIAVEDQIDALRWAESVGGLSGLIARADANTQVIADWVAASDWAAFLAKDPATRSTTSVCLSITDDWFTGQDEKAQAAIAKRIATLLEDEGVALDINGYRDAPAGLRIWCGATIEAADVQALVPWLDWAWQQVRAEAS